MECGGKGTSGTRCIKGPLTRRCARCGAVAYCSISHQISHWEAHKDECGRFEQQMRRSDVLHDFPFSFSTEATIQVCEKQVTRCSFLMKRDLHQVGMWKYECSCSASITCSDYLRINDDWILPSALYPCHGTFSFSANLVLSWPEKELLQYAVFGELHVLFPDLQVHIEFIGPAVPQFWDGEKIDLYSDGGTCKPGSENAGGKASNSKISKVTLQFRKGFYHEKCRDIVKESFPHLIFAANAGIAAYRSWLPTIELINEMGVPAIFSDFCEEAANLAASCVNSVTGRPLTVPIQLNPFRQPMVMEDSPLLLPCFSNCFLFGM